MYICICVYMCIYIYVYVYIYIYMYGERGSENKIGVQGLGFRDEGLRPGDLYSGPCVRKLLNVRTLEILPVDSTLVQDVWQGHHLPSHGHTSCCHFAM